MNLLTLLVLAIDYQLGLKMVNQIRQKFGIPPLRISGTLNSVASRYAGIMASRNAMGHSVDGSRFDNRIKSSGYKGSKLAENVGEGYQSIVAVIKGWIASPGHFKNLINPAYTEVGIGMAVGRGGKLFWSQEFGDGRSSSGPVQKPYSRPSYPTKKKSRVKWVCPKGYRYSKGKCDRLSQPRRYQ